MAEADGENVCIAPGAQDTTSALEGIQQWRSGHFKAVDDSVQVLYANFQALKTDISLGTFAYDLVKFDESGLTVAGAQVRKPNHIQNIEAEMNRRWPQLGNEPPVTRAEVEQSVATVRRTAASAREEAQRASSDLRNMRQRVSEARAPRQEPSRGFMGPGRTRGDIARLRAEIELLRAALGWDRRAGPGGLTMSLSSALQRASGTLRQFESASDTAGRAATGLGRQAAAADRGVTRITTGARRTNKEPTTMERAADQAALSVSKLGREAAKSGPQMTRMQQGAKKASGGFKQLNKEMKGNILGMLLSLLTPAVERIVAMATQSKAVQRVMKKVFTVVGEVLKKAMKVIGPLLSSLGRIFKSVFNGIRTAVSVVVKAIVKGVRTYFVVGRPVAAAHPRPVAPGGSRRPVPVVGPAVTPPQRTKAETATLYLEGA